MTPRLLRTMLVSATLTLPLTGLAAEQLNVLCASDNDWCELMRNAFQKETGIETSMVRKSAGEIFAQVRAEASNPKTDIWWAGTGDPHLQAANAGIKVTTVYHPAGDNAFNDPTWGAAEAKKQAKKRLKEQGGKGNIFIEQRRHQSPVTYLN